MNAPVRDHEELRLSALKGLSMPQKMLESKWFYDEAGSALFEEITALPEYYPTQAETEILIENHGVLSEHIPDGAALVELGSGASIKTRVLLDEIAQIGAYVPIDISGRFLEGSASRLRKRYPSLPIRPVIADFSAEIPFPADMLSMPLVGFFPGSTIGNLEPADAINLLKSVRNWPGVQSFLLGVDLVKNTETLIRAYDDRSGITAKFNLNILARLNRELGADFDLAAFRHEARWNEKLARIEMHLISTARQVATVSGQAFSFEPGESIHTENSHKYTEDSIDEIAARAGWRLGAFLTNERREFAVCVLNG